MIALDEYLIASADAHHLVAKIVVANGGAGRSHGESGHENQSADSSKHRQLRHQSPPRTATVSADASGAEARTRLAASAAVMFGISATPVPKTTTPTPIHIHATSGFRKTLMMGCPVSG